MATRLPTRLSREAPMRAFEREIERLFQNFFMEPFVGSEGFEGAFLPNVDVDEDEKEVHVRAELPGLSDKDLDLSLHGNELVIKGQKKEEQEKKDKGYFRHECRYGSFSRSIELPSEVDESKAQAEFKDGVLTIKLPKKPEEEAEAKRIKIQSS